MMYKKIISGVLAVTLTFGAGITTMTESKIFNNSTINASAEEVQAEKDGFLYDLRSGEAIVTGTTKSGEISIPSEITVSGVKYAVTEIKSLGQNDSNDNEEGKNNENKVSKIFIPSSVKVIDNGAFKNCTELTLVVFENSSIEDIPESCFENCTRLESVKFPLTLRTIQKKAFSGSGIKEIVLPSPLTSIGEQAFSDCENLTNVKFLFNLEKIGDKAFYNCKNLKKIKIPYNVKELSTTGQAFGWSDDGVISDFMVAGCDNESSVALQYANYNSFKFTVEHEYIKWEETKPATCTSEGEQKGTCSCGAETVKVIPVKEHQYSDKWTIDKKATTSSVGSKSHHCTSCDAKTDVTEIPKLSSSLSGAKFSKISDKVYTGRQIKPAVKVTMYGETLVKNRDYTVSYGKNKIGKASVTIKGKGNYSGKVTKYFHINPRKTTVSVKATGKGRISIQTTKKPEASKYQVCVSKNKNFKRSKSVIVSFKKGYVLNRIEAVVGSKKTYYIRVRTIAKGCYSEWSNTKSVKTK